MVERLSFKLRELLLEASEKMFEKIDYIEGLHSSLPNCNSQKSQLSASINLLDFIAKSLEVVDERSIKMTQKFDLMKVDSFFKTRSFSNIDDKNQFHNWKSELA